VAAQNNEPLWSNRIIELDVLKVVALLCLFIVHSTVLSVVYPELRAILFSFLNTSFMFVAGYLCYKSIFSTKYLFKDFWSNKIRTIIIPFVLFMIISYIIAGVPIGPQFLWSITSYSLGLRVFTSPLFFGLDFWFVSTLISYFIIFSFFGRHPRVVLSISLTIVLLGFYYFVSTPPDSAQLLPSYFLYLIPFALGYAWKTKFSDPKILILVPIILPLAFNITAIDLNLWGSVFMITEQLRALCLSICLTLVMLFSFNKLANKKFKKFNTGNLLKAFSYVGSCSLAIYMLEPLFSVITTWFMFPGYIGNFDTQAVLIGLSPLDSLKRLPVSIIAAFFLCPLILKYIGKCIAVSQNSIIKLSRFLKLSINKTNVS
jgi:hypothetical protein